MSLSGRRGAWALLLLLSLACVADIHATVVDNSNSVHIHAKDDPDGDVEEEAEDDANDADRQAAEHEEAANADEEAENDEDEIGDEEGQNHEDDDEEDKDEDLGEDEHSADEESDEDSKPTDEEDNREDDDDNNDHDDSERDGEEDEEAQKEEAEEKEGEDEDESGSGVESEQDEVDSAEEDAEKDEDETDATDEEGSGDEQDGSADAANEEDTIEETKKEDAAESEEKTEEEEEKKRDGDDDKNSKEEEEDKKEEKKEEKKAAKEEEEKSSSSSNDAKGSSSSSGSAKAAAKSDKVRSAISDNCQACRMVVIGAISRNTTGLQNPCNGHAKTMVPACNAFMAENHVRIMKAIDPNPICVSLGFCSRDEATLAASADKEKASFSKAINGKLKMESGKLVLSSNQEVVRHMRDGTGHRQVRERVPFPTPFEHPPFVHVGLSKTDIEGGNDFRIKVIAENIDRYGFDMAVTTWDHTEVNAIGVEWFAYGKAFAAKGLIRSGRLHATNPTKFEKLVSFPVAFPTMPRVVISFNGLDAVTGRVMRANVEAVQVDRAGFKARFATWKDSIVRYVSASWVAFANETKSAAGVHTVTSDVDDFKRFWNPPLGKRVYEKEIKFKKAPVKVCPKGATKTVLLEADVLAEGAPAATARTDASVTGGKCKWINATGPGFVGPPGVRTEISKIEFASEKGDRVDIEAVDVDKDGFVLRVQTDKDTRIKTLAVNWFAHEKPIEWQTDKEELTMVSVGETTMVDKVVKIAPKNNALQPGASCKAILDAKQSHGDGYYWVKIQGTTLRVYCDMTQGGWMRVINIAGASSAHANNANAVDPMDLADPTKAAKLADTTISALDTVGYFRFKCGSYDSFVTNDKKVWSSKLNNSLKWLVSRTRNPNAFTCQATKPGHTFSEESSPNVACRNGYAVYAARSAHDGTGCYHNGWGKSGSVWVQ